jgi:hypothetical protein
MVPGAGAPWAVKPQAPATTASAEASAMLRGDRLMAASTSFGNRVALPNYLVAQATK